MMMKSLLLALLLCLLIDDALSFATGGGGGGDGGDGDDGDDDLECPFTNNYLVGEDDPNPCMAEVCLVGNWAISLLVGEALPPCTIQLACCPIIHAYCHLQPSDPQCKPGSNMQKIMECPYGGDASNIGCPGTSSSTSTTHTTATHALFSTTATTVTSTTTVSATTSTRTYTTRTFTSVTSSTQTATSSTPCEAGVIVHPIYGNVTMFRCKTGNQCIKESGVCNGVAECNDDSDEEGCTTSTSTTSTTTTTTTSTTTTTTGTGTTLTTLTTSTATSTSTTIKTLFSTTITTRTTKTATLTTTTLTTRTTVTTTSSTSTTTTTTTTFTASTTTTTTTTMPAADATTSTTVTATKTTTTTIPMETTTTTGTTAEGWCKGCGYKTRGPCRRVQVTGGLLVCDVFADEATGTCRDGFVPCDGFTEPPVTTTTKLITTTAKPTTTTSSSSTVTETTVTKSTTSATSKTTLPEATSTITDASTPNTATTTTTLFVRVVTAANGVTVPARVIGRTTTRPGGDASTDPSNGAAKKKGVSAGGVVAILGSIIIIACSIFFLVRLRKNRTGGFDLTSPRMAARLRAASDAGNLLSNAVEEPIDVGSLPPKRALQLFGPGGGGGGDAGEAIGLSEVITPRTPLGSRLAKNTSTGRPVLLFDGVGGGGGAVGFGLSRQLAPTPKRVFRFEDAESSDDEDFGIKMIASKRDPSIMNPVFQLAGPGGGAATGSATETRRPTVGAADRPIPVAVVGEPGESEL